MAERADLRLRPGATAAQYAQDQPLYRHSRGHGGVYCEACHDSTHAIAPSSQANDHLKFMELQGDAGPLRKCNVCHLFTPPQGTLGPHGLAAPADRSLRLFHPGSAFARPGDQVIYTHTLRNTGNINDTYNIVVGSSQAWATVTIRKGGVPVVSPVSLNSGQEAIITVQVDVPNSEAAKGLAEVTTITATSVAVPAVTQTLTDVTLVPLASAYMPVISRN